MSHFTNLRRELELELDKINNRHHDESASLKAEFDKQQFELEASKRRREEARKKIYIGRSAMEMCGLLETDLKELKNRGNIDLDIADEDIPIVQKIYVLALDKLGRDRAEAVVDVLRAADTSPKLINAVDYLLRNKWPEHTITSYISVGKLNSKSFLHLLFPIGQGDSKSSLSANLEDKVGSILMQGEVESLKFYTDYKYDSKGLLTFSITPEIQIDIGTDAQLVQLLQDKFSKLQPSRFALANLMHAVESVDADVMNHFNNNGLEEICSFKIEETEIEEQKKYIALEEAARLARRSERAIKKAGTEGKISRNEEGLYELSSIERYAQSLQPKGLRRQKGRGRDVEKLKKEAFQRLNGYEKKKAEFLTITQIAEILDATYPAAHALAKKKFREHLDEEPRGKSKHYYVPVEIVRRYIGNLSAQKPKERKTETKKLKVHELISRLESMEKDRRLYSKDIKNLIGISYSAAANLLMRSHLGREEDSHKRYYTSPDQLRAYIDEKGIPKPRKKKK